MGIVPAGASASSTRRKKCQANLTGGEPCFENCEYSPEDVDIDAWLFSGVLETLVKSSSLKG